jgi:hypothetical protein
MKKKKEKFDAKRKQEEKNSKSRDKKIYLVNQSNNELECEETNGKIKTLNLSVNKTEI